jgi:hypothetical protein
MGRCFWGMWKSGELLCTLQLNFGPHKMQRISVLSEEISATERGRFSVEEKGKITRWQVLTVIEMANISDISDLSNHVFSCVHPSLYYCVIINPLNTKCVCFI